MAKNSSLLAFNILYPLWPLRSLFICNLESKKLTIGVLALQGSVREHMEMLRRGLSTKYNVLARDIRKVSDLKGINGLIIPGGESTVIGKLLKKYRLDKGIKKLAKKGIPIWGTCAGAIILAKKIQGSVIPDSLKLMDIEIDRNAYGTQVDSFEEDVKLKDGIICGVFIRAPIIKSMGKGVRVLAKRKNGEIIMAKQGNLLITTFHPELTDDTTVHKYFLNICGENSI